MASGCISNAHEDESGSDAGKRSEECRNVPKKKCRRSRSSLKRANVVIVQMNDMVTEKG